jgi:predicted Zn-dependent peptidase
MPDMKHFLEQPSNCVLVLIKGIAIFWASIVCAQDGSVISIESSDFKNIYYIPSSAANDVEISVIVHSGEADNPFSEGLGHYVEHLVWLGINSSFPEEFKEQSNAVTSVDSTKYMFQGNRNNFQQRLQLIEKVFEPLVFNESMIEEKDIILREYELTLDASSLYEVMQERKRLLYKGASLSRSVIGTPESIRTFEFEEAANLHRSTHVVENSSLLIVGDLDVNLIIGALDALELSSVTRTSSPRIEVEIGNSSELITSQSHSEKISSRLVVYSKLVSLLERRSSDEVVSLLLVKDLLEKYHSSSLMGSVTRALVFDEFIASNLNISFRLIGSEYLEMSIIANLDKNASVSEFVSRLERSVQVLSDIGIPSREFSRIKSRELQRLNNTKNLPRFVKSTAMALIESSVQPLQYEEILDVTKSITNSDLNEFSVALSGEGRVVIQIINHTPESKI